MAQRITRISLAAAVLMTVFWRPAYSGEGPTGPAPAAPAAMHAPNELTFAFVKVVAFKDGNCLIIKHGTATTNGQGEAFTDEVPDTAVLGTFWAVPKEGRILSMNAGMETTVEKIAKPGVCNTNLEILTANKGKECTVVLEDKTTYTGVIREVLTSEAEVPVPETPASVATAAAARASFDYRNNNAYFVRQLGAMPMAPDAVPEGESSTLTAVTGTLFVLKTAAGDVLLPVGQVRSLSIAEMNLNAERKETRTKHTKRLTFKFEKADGAVDLELMYFTPGLRWIPTYRMEIAAEDNPKKEAKISLQAELLNEVEDLDQVPIDLVVGVPNFRFKDTISPMSLEATLRNVLALNGGQDTSQGNQALSNAYFSQRADSPRLPRAGNATEGGGALNLPADLGAGGSQDLFVYSLPKMSLKKGHRAAVPIFDATAVYHDVYTWGISATHAEADGSGGNAWNRSPLVLSPNQVWHQVELTNNTKVPWTTGPVLILQGKQPIAQELLTYTAIKTASRVPLTIAVDAQANYVEKETGRQANALEWFNTRYMRIDKEGSLTITNRKAEPIEVVITAEIGGAGDSASDAGKTTVGDFRAEDWGNNYVYSAMNNHSSVEWCLTVKPGETLKPSLKYHYFAR